MKLRLLALLQSFHYIYCQQVTMLSDITVSKNNYIFGIAASNFNETHGGIIFITDH